MSQNSPENVRDDYNRVAEEYANRLFHELDRKPLDRELLRRFAAAAGEKGMVCDLGCGPGQVARFLRDAGVTVVGLDLSPEMIAQARRLNPDIEFREANMLGLDLDDGRLAGIAAFYAIVNIPAESQPVAFAEMFRVLKPDGVLLLAFHIGGEAIRPQVLWGKAISIEFYHLVPEQIVRLLTEGGFAIEDVIEREPYAPEVEHQSRRAYVFARKPAANG